jgi:hypothetical protein
MDNKRKVCLWISRNADYNACTSVKFSFYGNFLSISVDHYGKHILSYTEVHKRYWSGPGNNIDLDEMEVNYE